MKNKKGGFTVIELIIIFVILGSLGYMALNNIKEYRDKEIELTENYNLLMKSFKEESVTIKKAFIYDSNILDYIKALKDFRLKKEFEEESCTYLINEELIEDPLDSLLCSFYINIDIEEFLENRKSIN